MNKRIYVDNSATSRPFPEVIEVMNRYYHDQWGNPSSAHSFGRSLRAEIQSARDLIAEVINASPKEVIFTSGGTESDNIALKGAMLSRPERNHLMVSAIEHPAILSTAQYLQKGGSELTTLKVNEEAEVSISDLRDHISDKTAIVSVMSANNEVGSIQPIEEMVSIAKEHNALFHADCVQSFMKEEIDVKKLDLDLASFSAHKVNGPKGVGLLYIKKGVKIDPLTHGGHHEFKKRAGTENVAAILGFAKAVEIGLKNMKQQVKDSKLLRNSLEEKLKRDIPNIKINAINTKRLPNISNISFECVEGEALLIRLDLKGVLISTGSACSSGSLEPSHVLMAMKIPHELAHGSIRFSFGHGNSMDDVDYIVEAVKDVVQKVREISPLWDSFKNRPISMSDAQANVTTY
ncbi:MAG: cysteine desulfurase family protein [Nitrospinota bacterium]